MSIVNYSNQPLEPVCDMHRRTGSKNVMYQVYEVLRMYEEDGEIKPAAIRYGFLVASSEDSRILDMLKSKINKQASGKFRFETSTPDDVAYEEELDALKLLPKSQSKEEYVPRICKLRRGYEVEFVYLSEARDFESLRNLCTEPTVYLCCYTEMPKLRIHVVAKDSLGQYLVNVANCMKIEPFWNFALIDNRDVRPFYTSENKKSFKTTVTSEEKMTQEDIDLQIAEWVRRNGG